jgi:hypothetical protein
MTDWLIWTTVVWGLIVGWQAAQVALYLLSRREYEGVPGQERTLLGDALGAESQTHRPDRA